MTPVALPELPDMEVFLPIARLTGKPQVWLTQKDALEMALRAVLAERAAERERAALIAEKHRDYVAGVSVGGLIATAIRNQP